MMGMTAKVDSTEKDLSHAKSQSRQEERLVLLEVRLGVKRGLFSC